MLKTGIVPPLRLALVMWVVYFLEYLLQMDLGYLGLFPREVSGLIGIIMAPLLHGSFNHLLSNTIPLLLLGGSVYFFYPTLATRVFFQCYVFTNILVWLFGRPFYHIGASGLVYGLAGFLMLYGIFKRNLLSVLVSALVIFFYGGMVYGLFTFDKRISYESHLMGAVVGGVTAYVLSKGRH